MWFDERRATLKADPGVRDALSRWDRGRGALEAARGATMHAPRMVDGDPRLKMLTETFRELQTAVTVYRAALEHAGLDG
jgi:hypothetical protein